MLFDILTLKFDDNMFKFKPKVLFFLEKNISRDYLIIKQL